MVAKDIRITVKREDGPFTSEISSARNIKSILEEIGSEYNLKFVENGLISDGILEVIAAAYKIGVKDVNRNIKSDELIFDNLNDFKEKVTVEVE